MGIKFYNSLDVAGIEVLASDPVDNLFAGRLYFNSLTFLVRVYNGSSWIDISITPESTPSGTINTFAGISEPSGWIFCDGRTLNSVSNPEYANLFTAISTTYGGTGASDFNIPDLRGEFARGLDDMGTAQGARGVDTGRLLGTNQGEATAVNGLSNSASSVTGSTSIDHDHNQSVSVRRSGTISVTAAGTTNYALQGDASFFSSPALIDIANYNVANISLSGGSADAQTISGDSETRPRNIALKYMIKL